MFAKVKQTLQSLILINARAKISDINHNNGHLMGFNSQSGIYSNGDHHSAITAASCDGILV